MRRKITSFLIAAAMLLSLVPCAMADSDGQISTPAGTITWSVTGNTLTIEGTGQIPEYFAFEQLSDVSDITRLVIGDGIERIGESAFDGMYNLETAELAASVKFIDEYAFEGLRSLNNITMPGVIIIDQGAFSGTSLSESVVLPDTLEVIGDGAFSDTYFSEFEISESVRSIGVNALDSRSVGYITVAEENPYYCVENNVLFNKDKTQLLYYPTNLHMKSWDRGTAYDPDTYVVPSTVTKIGDYAFNGANYLGTVVLPASVTELGEQVFDNETLSYIDTSANSNFTLVNGVLYDAAKTTAYVGLINILPEKVVIEDGVKNISRASFRYGTMTELVLPESVKTIGRYAFDECTNLETVSLYSAVKYIERYAFNRDRAISKVYFNGTTGAWNRLLALAEEERGNTYLFDAEVEISDPDGKDEPIFYNLEFNEGHEMWFVNFYAGTVETDRDAYVALYDKTTGALISLEKVSLTEESVMESVYFEDIPKDTSLTAAVYCWDSLNSMQPIWNTALTSE